MQQTHCKDFSAARKAGTNLWKKRVRHFLNNRLAFIGLLIIILILAAVLAAPLITSYDPLQPDFGNKMVRPCLQHPLGTDSMGRDMLSRLLYGGRTSLLIAVSSAVFSSMIGIFLGAIGGYYGGWIDKALVRISEIFMSFPQLILVMIVRVFIGVGTFNLIIIFALTGWVGTFRLVRGEYIKIKEETYIKVCESFGMGQLHIMFRQILPSVLSTAVVQFTINVPWYVMAEASLSFLGFGVPMSVPTWGTMLNAAKSISVIINSPHAWIVPCIAICSVVLAINFFGDGLRDIMDPKQQ